MKHSIEVALTRLDKLHATECLCHLCIIECKDRVYIGLHAMKHSFEMALTRLDKHHMTEYLYHYALKANVMEGTFVYLTSWYA